MFDNLERCPAIRTRNYVYFDMWCDGCILIAIPIPNAWQMTERTNGKRERQCEQDFQQTQTQFIFVHCSMFINTDNWVNHIEEKADKQITGSNLCGYTTILDIALKKLSERASERAGYEKEIHLTHYSYISMTI